MREASRRSKRSHPSLPPRLRQKKPPPQIAAAQAPHLQLSESARHPLPWLRRIGEAALPGCLAGLKSPDASLASLPEIEITIVNDADIARVHGHFSDDSTPTDVITLRHGEILTSVDTAQRQGLDHGQSVDHELARYLVHGLMHLAAWDEHEVDEARELAQRQESILKTALKAV